ncbi:MAG: AmmeMemoRadiSam system protein B [Chitinivibrionales bacterium]|nr:AmmeMemoRadiSam system protein B [Chitinivibrionales bacterium]
MFCKEVGMARAHKLHSVYLKLTGVLLMSMLNCESSPAEESVRKAVFAGSWYEGDPQALRHSIENYITSQAGVRSSPRLLISPHAGHPFSGPVAGKGYGTMNRDIKTVILLGPSHRVMVQGVSIPDVDYYETPLGKIPLDKNIISELRKHPMVGSNTRAHSQEHCLEIQLPFLQTAIDSFTLVPMLMSNVDPEAIAGYIRPYVDETTLVVASSDFAHVNSADQCKKLDKRSIETIMDQDPNGFIEACGETPIRVLLYLSKHLGLKPIVLDARNSQEIVNAPESGYTVGYASIVFVKKDENGGTSEDKEKRENESIVKELDGGDKAFLLNLARRAFEAAVKGAPPPEPSDIPDVAKQDVGCFVTLHKHGELRGCIGYIEGIKPLYEAIIDNAKNAALRDHRFRPVRPEELDEIKVEVSVLTRPDPVSYNDPSELLNKIVAGKDGIILNKGGHQSTYLPQVWEQIPDKKTFLEYLSRKAGMPSDGWKTAEVKRYRAIHFEE